MLAATSSRDSPLGLFHVVLRSMTAPAATGVGNPLKVHALVILKAACDIAADPSVINARTPPEAIELALRLKLDATLRDRVKALQALDGIPAEDVKELLTSFDPLAA